MGKNIKNIKMLKSQKPKNIGVQSPFSIQPNNKPSGSIKGVEDGREQTVDSWRGQRSGSRECRMGTKGLTGQDTLGG